MDLSERKKKILRAVIDKYIETAEPVGSKAISNYADLTLSPATIRNEMAELEELGFLEQPHTSSGRIPTPQGYRIYVNELMGRHKLSFPETEMINRAITERISKLDKLISDVGRLISHITNYPAYAIALSSSLPVTITRFDFIFVDPNTFIIVVMLNNNTVKNKLIHLPISVEQHMLVKLSALFNAAFTGITEDKITARLIMSTERAANDETGLVAVIANFAIELLTETLSHEPYFTGASHFLEHPEYQDPFKVQRLMNYLSDDNELLKLPAPNTAEGLKITIGPENLAKELADSSIIVARYDAGNDMQGLIGVVGPTRMDYSKISARLSYIIGNLGRPLSGDEILPAVLPTEDD